MKEVPVAPELSGLTQWLQSHPQKLKELKGHVVGLEFFAVGCANCVRAMPQMQKLHEQYGQRGLTLIGIHTPEFEREKDASLVKKFLLQKGITFPVAADNDHLLWNSYKNQYWPTLYLIDKQGRIRSRHIGEGGYHRIAQDIEILLQES